MPIEYLAVLAAAAVVPVLVIAAVVAYCVREQMRLARLLVEKTKNSDSLNDGAVYTRAFWEGMGSALAKIFAWIGRRK